MTTTLRILFAKRVGGEGVIYQGIQHHQHCQRHKQYNQDNDDGQGNIRIIDKCWINLRFGLMQGEKREICIDQKKHLDSFWPKVFMSSAMVIIMDAIPDQFCIFSKHYFKKRQKSTK